MTTFFDWITFGIAIAGFVISLILAILKIRENTRRTLLLLELRSPRMIANIRITNVGNRPVTIIEIGMVIRVMDDDGKPLKPRQWRRVPSKNLFALEGDILPFTLKDGEDRVIKLDLEIAAEFTLARPEFDIRAWDSTGKSHTSNRLLIHDPSRGIVIVDKKRWWKRR